MNYALQYTNRKRTISISVTPKMEVVVKAPKRVSKKEIDSFVLQKTNWITKKLAYFETRKHDFIEKQYINGEKHRLLGKEYKLQILNSKKDNVQIKDDLLVIKNSRIHNQFSTKIILNLWYKKQVVEYITKKAADVFKLFETEVKKLPEINFRKTKSRWGSCGTNGKIAFNPELVKADPKCIEYVVIHEFCHLLEHNHSKRFYTLLERKMSDWKVWKKRLEEFH